MGGLDLRYGRTLIDQLLQRLRADPTLRSVVDSIEHVNEPDAYTAQPVLQRRLRQRCRRQHRHPRPAVRGAERRVGGTPRRPGPARLAPTAPRPGPLPARAGRGGPAAGRQAGHRAELRARRRGTRGRPRSLDRLRQLPPLPGKRRPWRGRRRHGTGLRRLCRHRRGQALPGHRGRLPHGARRPADRREPPGRRGHQGGLQPEDGARALPAGHPPNRLLHPGGPGRRRRDGVSATQRPRGPLRILGLLLAAEAGGGGDAQLHLRPADQRSRQRLGLGPAGPRRRRPGCAEAGLPRAGRQAADRPVAQRQRRGTQAARPPTAAR